MSQLTEGPLFELAEILGDLPGGDVPGAWYASLDPEVLAGYQAFVNDTLAWNQRYAEMLMAGGLPVDTTFISHGGKGTLVALTIPKTYDCPPRWFRRHHEYQGHLIPRKRTRQEKASEVNTLWKTLVKIPQAISYLPGMPNALWCGDRVYLPQVRKPAQAVLVFLAADPATATEPFEPDEHWQRLKLSLWHLIQERQQAAADQVKSDDES